MPAVTPAEVQTLPSRTKIGIGVDVHRGIALRELLGTRPSAWWRGGRRAGPASASRNAPVHTDATRRHRRAARRTQATSSAVARRLVHAPTAGDEQRVDRAA